MYVNISMYTMHVTSTSDIHKFSPLYNACTQIVPLTHNFKQILINNHHYNCVYKYQCVYNACNFYFLYS